MGSSSKKKENIFGQLAGALLLPAELLLVADIVLSLNDRPAGAGRMLLIFAAVSAVLFAAEKSILKTAAVLAAVFLGLAAAAAGVWFAFVGNSGYRTPGNGNEASHGNFFRDRNVMLIVPHEDDDLNLLGGVLEEYTAGNSEVRVVFTTNGDFADRGRTRIDEAVAVLGTYGIPEENVVFLGYGDTWENGKHIYNSDDDEVLRSYAGYTETYGTDTHPAYNSGNTYTNRHFREDLRSVITEHMPDVIFCVDYDLHEDHRAASLFFDGVFGTIKKDFPEYCPLVLKGFAYSTAYDAQDDFYSMNILSTKRPDEGAYMSPANILRWEDRLRIPVAPESLARSLLRSDIYLKERMYQTQSARFRATGIINGDRVFWQRDTSSILYTSETSASSGNAAYLNDFMLYDTADIADNDRCPSGGVWTPAADDGKRSAVIRPDSPVRIDRICLYDNPSLSDNIADAEIVLELADAENGISDEVVLRSGTLEPGGSPTEICFDECAVSQIMVRILESEGEHAGISELEAYCGRHDYGTRFIKLQDSDGNFAYDYITDRDGEASFSLYSYGCSDDPEDYMISIDNDRGAIEMEAGSVKIVCPKGEECVLTAASADGSLSDSVVVRNCGFLDRTGQALESFIYHSYPKLQNTAAYDILRFVFHIFVREHIIL